MTNLTIFYSEMTGLVNEERTVSNVYLDFSKAFGTASHKILTEKEGDELWAGWADSRLC